MDPSRRLERAAAKPDRSRAVCVSVIVSPAASNPIVCVPGIEPARVDDTSIGRLKARPFIAPREAAPCLTVRHAWPHDAPRGSRRQTPAAVRRARRRARQGRRTDSRRARSSARPPRRFRRPRATRRTSASLAPQPVVPMTTFMRRSASRRKFSGTASATEKSIATSACGHGLGAPLAIRHIDTTDDTSKPYSGASDSTSFPIRP